MKFRLLLVSLIGSSLIGMYSCTGDEPFASTSSKKLITTDESSAPIVRTDPELTDIASGTATVSGYIDSEGSSRIRVKGFVYSDTTSLPTIQDKRIYIISGDFKKKITGLKDGVIYYVRAYAINETDTAYGASVEMITTCTPSEIITMPVINRVKRGAIVCGQFTKEGEIKEYGVCLSLKPNPTINDTYEKAPDVDHKYVIGSFGVFFDNLEPQTMYHVRAYAIQKDDKIVYGNDRIFQTTSGGRVKWWWVYDERAIVFGCKDAITQAMDSSMYYYNNYSNLVKDIKVGCHEGTPTAQCDWSGNMQFGINSRYHWVGTAQHEISHAMGVGTASNWDSFFTNWVWNRPRAAQALRVMMKDMNQEIHVSGQHFWPGGINQREEVTSGTTNSYNVSINNARMLKLNAIVLNAMHEDGL